MLESDEKDAEEMAQHEDGSSIPTLGRRHTASRMSRSVRARLVCRSLSSIIPKRATRARRGAQDILFPTKGSRSQTTSRAACLGAEARASSFPLRSARRALVRDMRHTVQRQREPVGSRLGSGAVFDLNSNTRRYEGWTSADAAGLAILPGLVRDDEVYCSGEIQRFSRYRADDRRRRRACALAKISRASPTLSRECSARQRTSGLIVADNGSDMFVTGTMDPHWNNDVPNPAFRALISDDFGRLSRLALRTNPPCCDFENSCNNGAFRLKAPHTYTIGSP